jgi:hypothetical protein
MCVWFHKDAPYRTSDFVAQAALASIGVIATKERKNRRILGEGQDQRRGNGQYILSRIDRIAVVSLSGRQTLREFGDSAFL